MDGIRSAMMEKIAVVIHAVFPGLYRFNVTSYVVHAVALRVIISLEQPLCAGLHRRVSRSLPGGSAGGFPVNNQLMARVPFSNKTCDGGARSNTGGASRRTGYRKNSVRSGRFSLRRYEASPEHVMQMEAGSAKTGCRPCTASGAAPATEAVPVVPPVVPKAPAPPETPHRECEGRSRAIALGANNPYGAVSADVQVEQVVGLESTSIAPVSVTSVEEPARTKDIRCVGSRS